MSSSMDHLSPPLLQSLIERKMKGLPISNPHQLALAACVPEYSIRQLADGAEDLLLQFEYLRRIAWLLSMPSVGPLVGISCPPPTGDMPESPFATVTTTEGMSLHAIAQNTGIPYGTVYKINSGESIGVQKQKGVLEKLYEIGVHPDDVVRYRPTIQYPAIYLGRDSEIKTWISQTGGQTRASQIQVIDLPTGDPVELANRMSNPVRAAVEELAGDEFVLLLVDEFAENDGQRGRPTRFSSLVVSSLELKGKKNPQQIGVVGVRHIGDVTAILEERVLEKK